MRAKDMRMFEIFFEERKPKNVFELVEYRIWRFLGISPSKLVLYCLGDRKPKMDGVIYND